jgi:glycosyltransferase involved in cell wall biosynthesis
MRIVIVSRRYHPYLGGIETQTRLLASRLARRHHVEIVCEGVHDVDPPYGFKVLEDSLLLPRPHRGTDGPVRVTGMGATAGDRARMFPVAVRAFPWRRQRYFDRLQRFGYRHYRRVYVPKLRALVRGADVVHSLAHSYLGWAAQEAARAEGVPFVVTPYVHPGQYGDDAANVAYYRRADAVFALLETDERKLADLGVPRERLRLSGVTPLLPETSDAAGFRARHGLGGRPVVLFLGRLEEYKGALALLRSAAHIWRDLPDTHLLFAGPARARELRWFSARRDDRIRHLGLINEQEKADALAACDLFCMPSRFEVLPAVYLEAWAYGRAVVGGTAYGLRELIEGNGAGVTVEQDPERIAAHLVALLRDEPRRRAMGARGRALVERRFSVEALARCTEGVYAEVSGPRAALAARAS